MKGLLIIVNYNQEPEIGSLLERAARHHPIADTVLVDDGSTDGSRDIARGRGYFVIAHERNLGLGAAIRTGIRHAQQHGYDYVVISSSNGKIPPEQIQLVTAPLLAGEADYVQGSRFLRRESVRELPLFRRLAIPIFTLMANLVLRRRFSDITCGFRAYRLHLFDHPEVNLEQEWLNRYEMEYYIHFWACRLGLAIVEVPVEIAYSHLARGRRSKIRPVVDWWSMVRPFVLLTLRLKR